MKVLLDTDVLVDVGLERPGFADPATKLLRAIEERACEGFLAWHSAANLYYLMRPKRGGDDARRLIGRLTEIVEIPATDTKSLRQAAALPMADFEDAMQAVAALACGADFIATRNLKDYRKSPVPAAAPETILALL